MKKLTWLLVVIVASCVVVGACKKAPKPAEEAAVAPEKVTVAGGGVVSEKIVSTLSNPLCECMVNCEMPMSVEECKTQIPPTLSASLESKPVTINQGQLDACLSVIKKCECEVIMGNEPPPGCEFLK